MSTINKRFSINSFFIKNLKEIIIGKSKKFFCKKGLALSTLLFFCSDFIRNCICLQLGCITEREYSFLNHIWYGSKETETDITVFDFWINDKNITLGEFWMENFETDWSYMQQADKYYITMPMAQAAVHCISCIIAVISM